MKRRKQSYRVRIFSDSKGMRLGPWKLGLLGQEPIETIEQVAAELLNGGDLEKDILRYVLNSHQVMKSGTVRKGVSRKVRAIVATTPEEMDERFVELKVIRLGESAVALLFLRRRDAVPEKFLAALKENVQ